MPTRRTRLTETAQLLCKEYRLKYWSVKMTRRKPGKRWRMSGNEEDPNKRARTAQLHKEPRHKRVFQLFSLLKIMKNHLPDQPSEILLMA
ncbi:hypothetical protein ATANTOWER_015424 [Ataeniobius toweri]|uniref:Uncharacterized protein n=1 Tax=Ataeniobius toweri TaxID=208326 RepID=A0ABU7BYS9_9TELE|nr:hypothetical protein [Ataeniobius toweri]